MDRSLWDLDTVVASAKTGDNKIWNAIKESNDNQIRIVPGNPICAPFVQHWGLGRWPVVAAQYDNPATRFSKWAKVTSKSVSDGEQAKILDTLAKDVRPQYKFIFNVINRSNSTPTIQLWEAPKTVRDSIFNPGGMIELQRKLADKAGQFWNMFDPERGNDLIVGFFPDSKQGQAIWSVSPVPHQSPIGMDDWMEQSHDLNEAAARRVKSDEEITALILQKYADVVEKFGGNILEICQGV